MTDCRVRVRRLGADYVGHLTIHAPDVGSVITVAGIGSSMARALRRASSVAKRISNDPVMSALIPPQARAAIAAADKLSAAAEGGPPALREAMSQFSGPGAERLARVLASMNGAEREVGFLPAALLAAKYGPGIARAASKALKARKARKAKAKAAARRGRAAPPQYAPAPPPPPQYADESPEEYADDYADDDGGEAVEGVFSGLKRAVKFSVNPIAHTKATFRAARGVARKATRRRPAPPPPPEPEEYDDGGDNSYEGEE